MLEILLLRSHQTKLLVPLSGVKTLSTCDHMTESHAVNKSTPATH